MGKTYYLYPIWVRVWHGINAIMFLTLLLTGLSMQFSALNNPIIINFKTAVTLHNIAGITISINYLIFLLGNILTNNKKFYKIDIKTIVTDVKQQLSYYLSGMFKHEKPPFPINENRKFNPLQKIAYVKVMYVFLPIGIITGMALLFPEIIAKKMFGVGGLLLTSMMHTLANFFLSIFLVVHIYFCTMGKTPISNFKSIINGKHGNTLN